MTSQPDHSPNCIATWSRTRCQSIKPPATDAGIPTNHRILVIDDNRAIHDDFRKVLNGGEAVAPEMNVLEAALFGDDTTVSQAPAFQLDSAYQGEDGFRRVQQALAEDQPYALAFVDVRMPPGWDGLETTQRIWEIDPDVQIVLCTAYSDYSWEEMIAKIGQSDQFVILKKPFANIEVLQLANALCEKWRLLQQARLKVQGLEESIAQHREKEELARRALEREQELCRTKGKFVTMVSHEFRTPLGVISTATHLLDKYMDRLPAGERASHCREIQAAVNRMVQMMEDLLFYGNAEAGKLECKPAPLDLELVCRQLLSEMDHSELEPAVTCTVATAARRAALDGKLLRHILGNLLSNAVKYSDGAGGVSLAIQPATEEAGIQFTVSDRGIGIPAKELPKMFQTFHRASNAGQRPGTGMGLAIVKHCVDLHRGTIRCVSTEGAGTTFTVILPAVPLPPNHHHDSTAATSEPATPTHH